MKKTLISVAISLALSTALWLGGHAEQFAVYVLAVFSVLSWGGVLCGLVKGEDAQQVRRYWPISVTSSAVQIVSLIATGHPVLAASCFAVSFLIVAFAFGEKEVA